MIVDLGQSVDSQTLRVAIEDAMTTLAHLRGGAFRGTVAVSFIWDTVRVTAWPDDTVASVEQRWRQERAKDARKPTPAGYVGRRIKTD